jgi:hypothetical protein
MESFDALMWSNLEKLGKGTVHLDIRGGVDRSRLPGFMRLYERGYCTLTETGPGDSVHIFKITSAGQAMLDERK